MKLEEELKQIKPFKSELEKALVNILYTASCLESRHTQLLKPLGLSPQQYNIMRILKGQYPNPAPMGILAERMIDKNSNASRLIDKLILKEFVERKNCPEDRRQVHVILTKKGIQALEKINLKMEKERELYSFFEESKLKKLNSLLDELRK